MVAAVVDVGSNTIRLLVGRRRRGRVEALATEKVRVGLGEDVERIGRISDARLAAAAKAVQELGEAARKCGAADVRVLVTSPGRQAENAEELVRALQRSARAPVRVLTATEEGVLAYEGAVRAAAPASGVVAVCDMGGASTEIVVGEPGSAPAWIRSVDIGALRLTARFELGEKPDANAVACARAEASRLFASIVAPLPHTFLAVGGSARALRTLLGTGTLGAAELERAVELLATKPHRALTRRHGVSARRLKILLGGALILAAVQQRLVVPLEVGDGGVREGALLLQLEQLAA